MTDPTTELATPSAGADASDHREHASADVAPELFEGDTEGDR